MTKSTSLVINEGRQKVWARLSRGLNTYEIAKELNVDHCTVSRDIKFLTTRSQDYLNALAKETLPFMYQISIDGIRDVIRECYTIYESQDSSKVNMYHKLAALKLAKECHEAVFQLLDEGPSVMLVKQLQEKVLLIENRQIH